MKNKASSFGMYPWNFHSILLGGFQFQQIFVTHPIRVFKGCIIWNSVLNCLSLLFTIILTFFVRLRVSLQFSIKQRGELSCYWKAHRNEEKTTLMLKNIKWLWLVVFAGCVCVNPYPLFVCTCVGVCLLSIFKWIHLWVWVCMSVSVWVPHKLPFIVAFVCRVCRQVRWLNFL